MPAPAREAGPMARRGAMRSSGADDRSSRRSWLLPWPCERCAVPCACGGAELLETPFFAARGGERRTCRRWRSASRSEPALAELETLGRPGGELRMLMASPKDTRMMVVYGYARLVAYTPALAIVPGHPARRSTSSEGRIFTLHLRAGPQMVGRAAVHRRGFPLLVRGCRANNQELSPSGLPLAMLPNGEAPKFEVLDDDDGPLHLAAAEPAVPAGARRRLIRSTSIAPAHYLKQFHAEIRRQGEARRRWSRRPACATGRRSTPSSTTQYRNDNPDLPTLEPWVLKTKPPADRFVFERNPYYYRVDGAGHQLPYIDRVVFTIADSKIIPAKTGAGESDLQARYLRFDDYTFLKAGEADERLSRCGCGAPGPAASSRSTPTSTSPTRCGAS